MSLDTGIDVVMCMAEEAIANGFTVQILIEDSDETLTVITKEDIANIALFIDDSIQYTVVLKKGDEEYYAEIYDDLSGSLEEIFESHSNSLPSILPNTFKIIDSIS